MQQFSRIGFFLSSNFCLFLALELDLGNMLAIDNNQIDNSKLLNRLVPKKRNENARSFKLPLSFAYFSHLVRGLGTGTGFSLGSI